ncbi:MAG TPA: class I SAM-dependent methyltransferase, partial [Thermoleophilaceae bacterium]|nr:class I SAM-dependent methyltransferase [Thermoleophilaceae bacterium]
LDLLGDIGGLDVLYAGGASPLWLEGLSQRIGADGSLTALEGGAERLRAAEEALRDAELAGPVRLVAGDVFEPPFGLRTFDLVYSAGLLHELDVSERAAEDALAALISVVKSGGRVATSDFVDSVPAVQLEDEEIQCQLAREVSGARLYGIGPPGRLIGLHESLLRDVRWRVSQPCEVRHLEKLVLTEEESESLSLLPADTRDRLRERRRALLQRVRREGYTRPATLYVEGLRARGDWPKSSKWVMHG